MILDTGRAPNVPSSRSWFPAPGPASRRGRSSRSRLHWLAAGSSLRLPHPQPVSSQACRLHFDPGSSVAPLPAGRPAAAAPVGKHRTRRTGLLILKHIVASFRDLGIFFCAPAGLVPEALKSRQKDRYTHAAQRHNSISGPVATARSPGERFKISVRRGRTACNGLPSPRARWRRQASGAIRDSAPARPCA